MGSDQNVHFPALSVLDRLLLLRGGAEAAQHFNADRKRSKAAAEGVVMLEGEDGGRRKDRHLFVLLRHFEGGAHGDFRLAVSHVAAQQAVHRLSAFKIALDVP